VSVIIRNNVGGSDSENPSSFGRFEFQAEQVRDHAIVKGIVKRFDRDSFCHSVKFTRSRPSLDW
jgi:hypothetical protein